MNYQFKSLKQVLDLFLGDTELSAGEISEKLGKSRQLAHKYLKALTNQGKIEKIGKAPRTKYILSEKDRKKKFFSHEIVQKRAISVDYKSLRIIEDNFFKFSPTGEILKGMEGIQLWSEGRGILFEDTISQYVKIYKFIESLQDECGLLSAQDAFGKHFHTLYLDKIVYADQYIYSQFGRGKLAEISFYAKQSQNKALINDSIALLLPKLICLIGEENFDAIAITPWSVKRENQILLVLKKKLLSLQIPFINVIKHSSSGIFIPQKSLKKSEDRIKNAKNTIFIDDIHIGNYKKVLLIDDFVGSGATLNETAKKLKDGGVQEVIGFAFVGNTDLQYEVINEI